jgi:GT2 family glycosyltransferase
MSWEYLPELDERLKVAAKYLDGKTKGKTIVDLDCLEARLLQYIDHDFEVYLGNDVQERFPTCPKTRFSIAKDDEFVPTLTKCDILTVFGHGGYEITKEGAESPTLTNSIKYVIDHLKPEIVVLEAVWAFEPIISEIITEGYKLVLKQYLELGNDWVRKRVIYIYEREPHVAIVIGTRTKYDYLDQTLKHLFATTNPNRFYLIGVNQVPDKETGKKTGAVFRKWLRPQDIYIENDPEVGVYDFWNQGITKALENPKVEYVGVFNDDIILPPHWLDVFLWLFHKHETLYYLFPAWTCGPDIPHDLTKRAHDALVGSWDVVQDVLAGFCFMCPRKTFETEIGLFDTQFRIWAGDTDFYYRMLAKGYKTYRTDNVLIHHFYSRTLNEMRQSRKVEKILMADQSKLAQKYNQPLPKKLAPLRP